MRRLLALLVVLAVLVVAAVAGDRALTAAAEERVAARAAAELHAPVEVELAGWPVTARALLGGRVPTVRLRATGVPVDGGTIDRLVVTLTDVAIDVAGPLGADGLPRARRARFEARVEEGSLVGLLGAREGLLDLSLEGGVVTVEIAGVATAEATLAAEAGAVVVRVEHPLVPPGLGERVVDLSGEVGEPFVEEVVVGEGVVILRGRLQGLEGGDGP